MGLGCKLFNHKWIGCKCERCGEERDEQHNWDGCKCKRCKKIRDEQHDWDSVKCKCKTCGNNCSHEWDGCICLICGHIRVYADHKSHNWIYETGGCKAQCSKCGKIETIHDWNHCKCKKCGEHSSGENQCDWKPIENCQEQCSVCGKIRKTYNHQWTHFNCTTDKCAVCGKERLKIDPHHQWEKVDGSSQVTCLVCGIIYCEKHNRFHFNELKEFPIIVVNGKCTPKCPYCGQAIEQCIYTENTPESIITDRGGKYEVINHKWQPLSNCRKRCSVCGVLAYDHDYELIETRHGRFVGGDGYEDKYRCKKCSEMVDWTMLSSDKCGQHGYVEGLR